MSTALLDSKHGSAAAAAYGGLMDAIGGIATSVIAIVGLAGFQPALMEGIATIVFGAALLVQGGTLLSEYALLPPVSGGVAEGPADGGMLPMFLFGIGGIVLGVLALLGIASAGLTAIAAIAYGSALLLSSGSVRRLYLLQSSARVVSSRSTGELLAAGMAAGSAGVQLLSGLAVIVLGVLAISGYQGVLVLTALLVLGVTELLEGGTLSGLVMSFMRTGEDRALR